MKIRVATTPPRLPMKGYTIWNVRSIDEFADRFIRGDKIVIGDYTAPVYNFEKHNKYIATFQTIDNEDMNARVVSGYMMLALMGVDAPEDRAAFHNIRLDVIDDDRNPLLNPDAIIDWQELKQGYGVSADTLLAETSVIAIMNTFNPFDELAGSPSRVSNAEFFGETEQWNWFDAEQKKNLIKRIEAGVHVEEQKLRNPDDGDNIRKYISKAVLRIIDKTKDDYVALKKELAEFGIEAISDHYLYDDYYADKYRGEK